MTTQTDLGQEKKLVYAVLPWLVAASALILYLLTLNHWVSIASLPYVARATGRIWTPELTGGSGSLGPYAPPFYLVTYPVRWLPEKWVPLALNLFSAICAALTLALLARSVTLLPHDRTHEQRQREQGAFALLSLPTAWIPPVLAAAACGLQYSFWQNATAVSGDVFDLLLFAYVIRCVLEYRIAQRDSWLLRAALVCGVAMTGNSLMVGLLPAFIVSLVWIKGISFFNLRFLRGMVLCGLAGLLLYLLLPLIHMLSGPSEVNFWQALRVNLAGQIGVLKFLFGRVPLHLLLLLATTSFLPLLLISIRWASYFGDPSKLGIAITTGILHVAHAALLVVCIWVTFDPVFSPIRKGLVLPALNYLGALSVGYFTGYFLLVFRPVFDRAGRTPAWQPLLNRVSQAMMWGLLLLVPLGLIYKNLPQIRVTNGPALGLYASLLTQNLPPHAVMLCDSEITRGDTPQKLWLAECWLAHNGKAQDYMFLDTTALQFPVYHGILQKRYGHDWPPVVNSKNSSSVPPGVLINLLSKLLEQHRVYYLHPSFGYYFEQVYSKAHGLANELRSYPTNSVSPPPLTAAEITENENFWKENQPAFERLLPWINGTVTNQSSDLGRKLMQRLKIPFEANATAVTLGRNYSQSLVYWGVQLQQAGLLREARRHFDLALALNPNNLAAKANSECNKELQAGRQLSVPPIPALMEEFSKFRDWQQVMRDNGPFDDPVHCFGQGMLFAQGHLIRQAAQQFDRIHQFDPDNLLAQFWLARFYANQAPAKTLAMVSEIRAHPEAFEESGIRNLDISTVEAVALFASHRPIEAEQVLQRAMAEHPRDEILMGSVIQISGMFGRFTNALSAVERELQISPTNISALIIQGYLHMQIGNFTNAIPPFTRALSIDTNNYTARFDRAIAYLRNDQLDQSQRDYLVLEKAFPNSFRIEYGLGEIAWLRKDTNAAIQYYQLYLTNSISNSEEAKQVAERLQSLTSGSP